MNAQHRKTVSRFTRAVLFLETQAPELAGISPGITTQIQRLQDAVALINLVAPDRDSGIPAKTACQRAVLRRALRVGQLSPLRRSARVLARSVAGLPQLVPVVRISNTQGLLDAAKATAQDIAPYREQFVETGLAPDFLDQLQHRIQALEAAGEAHQAARLTAARARGELAAALRSGRDALTLLDSAVRQWCDTHPAHGTAMLVAWNTIVPPRGRVGRVGSQAVEGTTGDVLKRE